MPEPSQASNKKSSLPEGSFATCSADGTIRLWHLDLGLNTESRVLTVPTLSTKNDRPVNVYNKDILGVLYIGSVSHPYRRSPMHCCRAAFLLRCPRHLLDLHKSHDLLAYHFGIL